MINAKPVIELIDGSYLPAPTAPSSQLWKAMLQWEDATWDEFCL